MGLNSSEFLLKNDITTTKGRSGGSFFFKKRFSLASKKAKERNDKPDHAGKYFEIAEAAEASDLLSSITM